MSYILVEKIGKTKVGERERTRKKQGETAKDKKKQQKQEQLKGTLIKQDQNRSKSRIKQK